MSDKSGIAGAVLEMLSYTHGQVAHITNQTKEFVSNETTCWDTFSSILDAGIDE